jgi:hypothetical protein
MRTDLVVDAKASRIYNFTTSAEQIKKETAIEAIRRIVTFLQHAGK